MRLAGLAVMAIVAAPSLARADDVADVAALIAEGQELAKASQFEQAIDRFKRADRITPKAQHACMIGLTYLRLSMLPQSELFLTRCRQRATATDPLPSWMADAERQLASQLAVASVTTIDFRVTPADGATVTVSTFGADESFEPQRIHLHAGPHVIKVSAPGFVTAEKTIEVSGIGSLDVDIVLQRAVVAPVEPPPEPVREMPVAPPADHGPDHTWSNRLLVGAGVAAVGGIVFHVLAYRARGDLMAAQTGDEYRDSETMFDVGRATTFSLYGIAAIAGGLGLYLRLTDRDRGARVSADVRPGGAVVTIGWER